MNWPEALPPHALHIDPRFCLLAAATAEFLKRPALTAAVAIVLCLALGPFIIRQLQGRFRERIASDSARLNELHAGKKNTPTMGGVLIMLAFLTGSAIGIGRFSPFSWLVFGVSLAFCSIGMLDDWIKLKTSKKGLTVRQKLAAQTIISGIASVCLFVLREPTHGFAQTSLMHWLPGSMPWLLIVWSTFVIVASSNAVNLTDGLDGLAAGCMAICTTAMAVMILAVCRIEGSATALECAVFFSAMAGASLGFLWFNRHPARVFMGDTGSLPLGALLGLIAVACQMELLLLTGIVFVAETASVILQVFWFRRTGRRILLCSPLHNHFVFRRIRETRIVGAFWAVTMVAGVLAWMAVHWSSRG